MNDNLEKVMKDKVGFIIDKELEHYLGVKIDKINEDISDKIGNSPLISFSINTNLPFKQAKKLFKREFITKVIQTHYCNISKVADILDVNRRSIHRLIKDLGIDVGNLRSSMLTPTYYKQEMVDNVLRNVLDSYKSILHPKKLQNVYNNVERISENIAKELVNNEITLSFAEELFEKEYFKKALNENKFNISKTSKAIKLRYETLLRKIKKLGITT